MTEPFSESLPEPVLKPADLVFNDQLELNLTLSSPVKNAVVQHLSLAGQGQQPKLEVALGKALEQGLLESLALLLKHRRLQDCPPLPEAHIRYFENLKILLPAAELPQPPVFAPRLQPAAETEKFELPFPESLGLSPYLQMQQHLEPEAQIAPFIPFWQALTPERPLLWVRNLSRPLWLPYLVSAELFQQVQQQPLEAWPTALKQQLLQAQVLAPPFAQLQLQEAEQVFADKQFLQANGYLVLRQLLPPLQLQAIQAYLQQLKAQGYYRLGDHLVPERFYIHNEPLMRFLHWQLYACLRQLLPAPVQPSYTFLVKYPPGCQMARHTDREQCVWNMSLVLQRELPLGQPPWPIYLETRQGPVDVRLQPGDAVLYPGTEIPHWRPVLQAEHVDVVLFHFVSSEFQGPLT